MINKCYIPNYCCQGQRHCGRGNKYHNIESQDVKFNIYTHEGHGD
jgi:hypothetical protein